MYTLSSLTVSHKPILAGCVCKWHKNKNLIIGGVVSGCGYDWPALNSFAPCTPLVWKLWSNTVAVDKYLVNCLRADCTIKIHVRHWTRTFLPGRVWPHETKFQLGAYLGGSVSMRPPPVASNPMQALRPGFCLAALEKFSKQCETKSGTESLDLRPTLQLKTSCQNRYLRQVADGILSVASTLLPSLDRLLQLLRGGYWSPQSLPHTSLSNHDNTGPQLGAVQFLQVYSLYFEDNLKTIRNTQPRNQIP